MLAMIDVKFFELVLRGMELFAWIYDEIPA